MFWLLRIIPIDLTDTYVVTQTRLAMTVFEAKPEGQNALAQPENASSRTCAGADHALSAHKTSGTCLRDGTYLPAVADICPGHA
ncbi:MAG: hypothetical protein AAFW87_13785 [Pseudomonadota bacterium]